MVLRGPAPGGERPQAQPAPSQAPDVERQAPLAHCLPGHGNVGGDGGRGRRGLSSQRRQHPGLRPGLSGCKNYSALPAPAQDRRAAQRALPGHMDRPQVAARGSTRNPNCHPHRVAAALHQQEPGRPDPAGGRWRTRPNEENHRQQQRQLNLWEGTAPEHGICVRGRALQPPVPVGGNGGRRESKIGPGLGPPDETLSSIDNKGRDRYRKRDRPKSNQIVTSSCRNFGQPTKQTNKQNKREGRKETIHVP
mmetsp:Transcript_23005/g.54320  ORF Transcript_23005/g.54320 Transcript_23005/m.54320 type:complete len:250 (-) Transcript_23005:338-1087(-)